MDNHVNNNGTSALKLWQLLGQAEQLVGKSISLSSAKEFFSACGLSEKAEYSHQEAQQFLSVCDQVLNQGMSLTQIRQARTDSQTQKVAQKKSMGLAEELAQAMDQMDEDIHQQFPLIVQQKMEELLAEPGLLEEILAEARTRILKAEADGISLDEDYCAWLNDREKILAQIRHRLSKKRNR
ncbi:MAG: hypothetical protein ACRDEA_14595 [Microcystaceae cyanobacterium]